MSGFENFQQQAIDLEREIVRHGIVLGIDWQDEVQVRMLAREALTRARDASHVANADPTPQNRARAELFAFAALMLRVMQESAEAGLETHGGTAWKAFGRALWIESGLGQAG